MPKGYSGPTRPLETPHRRSLRLYSGSEHPQTVKEEELYAKIGVRLKQLIEEVRREESGKIPPHAYDRIHSRHNRSM